MAFRLKFSSRALREIGEAREWYELQSPGLGDECIAAMELQLKRLEQFPNSLFYTVCGNITPKLGVLHDARNPKRWPKNR